MMFNSIHFKRFSLTCFTLISILTSCQGGGKGPLPPSTTQRPLVVVSVPPYLSLVRAIAGDRVDVASALPPNYDPHSAEITPSERSLVGKADLFIRVGEQFESRILTSLQKENHSLHILNLYSLLEDRLQNQDRKDDHNHSHGGHHHPLIDTHFWLSLKLLPIQINSITEALIRLCPEFKKEFSEKSLHLLTRVKALDTSFTHDLAPLIGGAILVPHAALGYFCSDYHLIQIAVEYEGKSPLPRTLSDIAKISKSHPLICAFTFPAFDNRGVTLLSQEHSLKTYAIDPMNCDCLGTLEEVRNRLLGL